MRSGNPTQLLFGTIRALFHPSSSNPHRSEHQHLREFEQGGHTAGNHDLQIPAKVESWDNDNGFMGKNFVLLLRTPV